MRDKLLSLPLGLGVLADALFTGGDFLLLFGAEIISILLLLGTELFTPLAISASWLAPEISWLDEGLITFLTVAAAALYVTNLLVNRYNRYKENSDD